MSTCCIYAGHTTTTHTPDESGNLYLGYPPPLLLQDCAQSLERSWSWNSLSYKMAENVPNMLDWRQVRGSSRPIEMIHIVLLHRYGGGSLMVPHSAAELLYYPRPMRSCVVILQHYVVLLNKAEQLAVVLH